MITTIRIDNWHPAPLNKIMKGHWAKGAKLKKADREMVAVYVRMAEIVPQRNTATKMPRRRVSLHVVLPPKQRAYDRDALWKSLLDSLVHAGALTDDSPKWCEVGKVTYSRGETLCSFVTIEDV